MRAVLLDTIAYTAFMLGAAEAVDVVAHADSLYLNSIVLGELLGRFRRRNTGAEGPGRACSLSGFSAGRSPPHYGRHGRQLRGYLRGLAPKALTDPGRLNLSGLGPPTSSLRRRIAALSVDPPLPVGPASTVGLPYAPSAAHRAAVMASTLSRTALAPLNSLANAGI